MKHYAQFWKLILAHPMWWFGVLLLVTLTALHAVSPPYWDDNRGLGMALFAVGLLIAEIGFFRVVISGAQETETFRALGSLMGSLVVGIGGGFLVNSLLAEVLGYSLKPREAPYSWAIIWGAALMIASGIMFTAWRERRDTGSRVDESEGRIQDIFQ